jgi:hypothetical protein
VDCSSDKIYDYAGAASRLSGSQSAASSFSLVSHHNGSTNPQDIVTDGTSFWIVDGSALKVFKYTLSGSLLGSWGIDPANAHPTGITINPNNVSDIWIVDNGTDQVYQYVGAASRTSGSQNASATFALNPSDTNPQGIADPPPADMLLSSTAALLAEGQVTEVAFPAEASGGVSAAVDVPSPAGRDAIFAQLVGEAPPRHSASSVSLPAGEDLASWLDRATHNADRVWTLVGVADGQKLLGPSTPLLLENVTAFPMDHNAVGLPDESFADEDSTATDSLFADLAMS